MQTHVIRTMSRFFGALRQLRSIRRSVLSDTFQGLVVLLVLSRLDYENAIVAGLPVYLLSQLQAVMNAGVRLIFNFDRRKHTTPLLRQLYLLLVPDQITFKNCMATIMFQCVNGTGPQYLSSDVRRVAYKPCWKHLRLTALSPLIIPATRRSSIVTARYGRRCRFSLDVKSATSIPVFRRRLKTHLFDKLITANCIM